MRPLRLEMTAFGPYKEKTIIDFRDFKSQSLFLVCGPTGAGKTTIFDAIAYALYDDSSGESRNKDTFKSQFATNLELCEVTFLFEIKGKEYKVIRSPKQTGPAKKKGATKSFDSAVTFYHDGNTTTKIKEANEEIAELLSLTYDQFKQIVMLPQGEFKKLLESDSKDKETIFRDIFRTEPILFFQEDLKKQAATLKKDAEDSEISLRSAFNFLTDIEDEELISAIDFQDTKKVLERLDQLANDCIEKEASLSTQLKTKELQLTDSQTKIAGWKKYEELTLEYENLKSVSDHYIEIEKQLVDFQQGQSCLESKNQWQFIQTEVSELESSLSIETIHKEHTGSELQLLQESFSTIETDYQKISEWRQEKDTLVEQREKLLQLKSMEAEKMDLEKLKEELEVGTKNLKIKLEKTKTKKMQLKDTIQKIIVAEDKLWKIKECKQPIQDSINHLKNEEKEMTELERLSEKLGVAITDLKGSQQKYEQQSNLLTNQRVLFNNNLAGILASDLIEGEACPVCGSTDHPSPRQLISKSPSEEQLEKIEKNRDVAYRVYSENTVTVANLKKQIKNLEEALGFSFDNFQTEKNKLKDALTFKLEEQHSLEKEITELSAMIAEKSSIQSQLDHNIQMEQSLELKNKETQTNISNYILHLKKLETAKRELLPNILELDLQLVTTQIKEYSFRIEELEKKYPLIKNEINELEKILAGQTSTLLSLQTQIKTTKKKLKKAYSDYTSKLEKAGLTENFENNLLSEIDAQQKKDTLETYQDKVKFNHQTLFTQKVIVDSYGVECTLEKIESEYKQLQELKSELESKISEIRLSLQTITKGHSSIQIIYKKQYKVLERFQRVRRLSEIANGTSKETGRMSFERYVLAIYYEEIVKAANIRLQQMTANRYLLRRTIETGKGAGAKGLELDVFDQYTGQSRSVKTLSGGESFKASLALALGLSDVMQTQSGGIQIDTLFIDEGFGTLDSESLDQAIETLAELNARGRIIGVISHVDELKTRIPAHIEVTHTLSGSHAEIVI